MKSKKISLANLVEKTKNILFKSSKKSNNHNVDDESTEKNDLCSDESLEHKSFNKLNDVIDDEDYDEFKKMTNANDQQYEEMLQKQSNDDKDEDEDGDGDDVDEDEDEDENENEESDSKSKRSCSSTGSQNYSPETSFFYTSDKFINSFEDDEITKYIQEKFPLFRSDDANDAILRKTIIEILNDVRFMTKLLEYYNMTIFDFFKYLYRQESSLFKGQFLKRLQKAMKYKKYAITAKKQAFRYSPRHKSKRKAKR